MPHVDAFDTRIIAMMICCVLGSQRDIAVLGTAVRSANEKSRVSRRAMLRFAYFTLLPLLRQYYVDLLYLMRSRKITL